MTKEIADEHGPGLPDHAGVVLQAQEWSLEHARWALRHAGEWERRSRDAVARAERVMRKAEEQKQVVLESAVLILRAWRCECGAGADQLQLAKEQLVLMTARYELAWDHLATHGWSFVDEEAQDRRELGCQIQCGECGKVVADGYLSPTELAARLAEKSGDAGLAESR